MTLFIKAQKEADKVLIHFSKIQRKQQVKKYLAKTKGNDVSIEIDMSPSQLSLNHLTNIIKTEYSLLRESILVTTKVSNILVRDDKDVRRL